MPEKELRGVFDSLSFLPHGIHGVEVPARLQRVPAKVFGFFGKQHAAAGIGRRDGRAQPGGAGTDNDDIGLRVPGFPPGALRKNQTWPQSAKRPSQNQSGSSLHHASGRCRSKNVRSLAIS